MFVDRCGSVMLKTIGVLVCIVALGKGDFLSISRINDGLTNTLTLFFIFHTAMTLLGDLSKITSRIFSVKGGGGYPPSR